MTMLYMYYVYTKFLYQSQKVIFVMWHQRASIIIKTEETFLHSSSLAKGFRSTLLTIKPLADLITNAAAANHKIEPVADFRNEICQSFIRSGVDGKPLASADGIYMYSNV